MKTHYYITKDNYNGEVVFVNCRNGYKFSPKKNIKNGIKVDSLVIVKPSMVEKIIKKKIKNKLDYYLKVILMIMENNDDDDARRCLDDLQRYRYMIKNKYINYLDDKDLELLDKKMKLLERQLKSHIIYEEEVEKETKRSR